MVDINAALLAYSERVAAAPLLTEAELHRKAFELLKEHASMLDASMSGEQARVRLDTVNNPSDAVGKAIQEIREAVFEIGVLAHKREVGHLMSKATKP
jgi:hypothetical protein